MKEVSTAFVLDIINRSDKIEVIVKIRLLFGTEVRSALSRVVLPELVAPATTKETP